MSSFRDKLYKELVKDFVFKKKRRRPGQTIYKITIEDIQSFLATKNKPNLFLLGNTDYALNTERILLDGSFANVVDGEFTWNLSKASSFDNTLRLRREVQNIVSIKLLPFVFTYLTSDMITDTVISIGIRELSGYSYALSSGDIPVHFLFKTGDSSINSKLTMSAVDLDTNLLKLSTPLTSLESITMVFGDPLNKISRIRTYTTNITAIANGGGGTVDIDVTEYSDDYVGSTVTITNFTTNQPLADAAEIARILSSSWTIDSGSDPTVTIAETLTLSGTVVLDPAPVLTFSNVNSFKIPCEIKYMPE